MKPLVYILPLEYPVKGGVEIKETEFIEKAAYDEAERQNAALALKAEEQAELIDKLVGAVRVGAEREPCRHYECCSGCRPIYECEEALDEFEKWKASDN